MQTIEERTITAHRLAIPRRRHHRAPTGRPRWAVPGLVVLLLATAGLYLWNLSASGFANTFYAAAAQAGSQSWKAWFFGSLDAENFITVDKPPASLWVMGLSARIFGFSSWSVLAPQALEGVAAVAVLVATVRRVFRDDPRIGWAAGLAAGALLALTPAAALMFRFDNPDALLVLLMTVAAYTATRAQQAASGRWLALTGVVLGFAFLTKMLQGLLVLPAFALAYLLFADTRLRRRLLHLLGAAVALVAGAGWWVAIVDLWPADSRPYIGGSTDNTALDLALGYNGLGRILGQSGPGGGGSGGGQGAAGSGFGGQAGLSRLFSSEMGYEISWLLPAALVALLAAAVAVVLTRRRAGTRDESVALVLWGGWLLVTGLVFSYMSGTMHSYYTVALAPAVAALVAIGTAILWRRRESVWARIATSAIVVAAASWSIVLLARADFGPVWLRWVIGLAAAFAAVGLVLWGRRGPRALLAAAVLAGIVSATAGTASFAVATAATAHHGSIPTAVASVGESGMGGPGGGGPGGGAGGPGGQGGQTPGGDGQAPIGQDGQMPGGDGQAPTGQDGQTAQAGQDGQTGQAPTGQGGQTGQAGGQDGPGGGGGMGGQGENAELTALLQASTARWAAAVSGSQTASGYELATGKSVMAMGGWSGDPTPTLEQFIAYVEAGDIDYYIGGGGMGGGPGGSSSQSEIAAWVAEHYTATTVGGITVYDLTT